MTISNRQLFVLMLVLVPACAVVGAGHNSLPDSFERYWYVFGVLLGVFVLGMVTAVTLDDLQRAEDAEAPADPEEAKWRKMLDGKVDDRYGLGRLR